MGINYFRYNGKNSIDFNVFISGELTYTTPNKDVETVAVPGRNGTLSFDNNRFNNIAIKYPSFIVHEFAKNFDALKAWLNSVDGYAELSDTYDLEHYRRARFVSEITPTMDQFNRHGTFDIIFDCDPRRFLRSGDKEISISSSLTLKNPTQFDAKPLLSLSGSGRITINGTSIDVSVSPSNTPTIIDCDTQEAYYGETSRNSNITLVNGDFPKLAPGLNTITYQSFSSCKITPRWWTI